MYLLFTENRYGDLETLDAYLKCPTREDLSDNRENSEDRLPYVWLLLGFYDLLLLFKKKKKKETSSSFERLQIWLIRKFVCLPEVSDHRGSRR
jgi:hypothetical protein